VFVCHTPFESTISLNSVLLKMCLVEFVNHSFLICGGCECSNFVTYCADDADMPMCCSRQTKHCRGNVLNPAPIFLSSLSVLYGTCCLKTFHIFVNYCPVGTSASGNFVCIFDDTGRTVVIISYKKRCFSNGIHIVNAGDS